MCSLQKTLQICILLGKSFYLRYNLTLYDQYFVFVPLWLLPCQNNGENPAPAILMTPGPGQILALSDYDVQSNFIYLIIHIIMHINIYSRIAKQPPSAGLPLPSRRAAHSETTAAFGGSKIMVLGRRNPPTPAVIKK